ncbi:MAG: peptidase domain-containing ABC transporter [Xanthomonadales bacterium]|nr:peptidase domain-containing ABC transporter [Xanthomonadales bacterium]
MNPARTRQTPLIYQSEAAECGLACALMVAATHGSEWDFARARQQFDLSSRGANLAELMSILRTMGMRVRPLRADLESLRDLAAPLILHWDLAHFVVLVKASRHGAVVHDPRLGRRELTWAEVSRHFSGIAVEALPTAALQRQRAARQVSLRQITGHIPGLGRPAALVLAAAVAVELSTLLSPLLLKVVTDDVITPSSTDLLLTVGVGFALVVMLQSVFAALRSWSLLAISTLVGLHWKANVLERVVRLPLAFFAKRQLGDVTSRFDGISQIQRVMTTAFIETLIDATMSLLVFAAMLLCAPRLAFLSLMALLVVIALRALTSRRAVSATQALALSDAGLRSHFLETIRAFQAIKLFGREGVRESQWLNLANDACVDQIAVESIGILQRSASTIVFGLERVAVVAIGAAWVVQNELSFGLLLAFLAYREQFASRIATVVERGFEMRNVAAHKDRLADLVLTEPEPEGSDGPVSDDASVRFESVSFRYSRFDPLVLRDVSFTVDSGEFVAIAGPSGCGKSTLVKLLLGLHEPTSGTIHIRQQSSGELSAAARRRGMAAVMQDDYLLGGTIIENISMFDSSPDEGWVQQCAALAGIDADIEALPMKYLTLIGEAGNGFSGGQKQRLLLARALYARPSILVMDEATSFLDQATERRINAALKSLSITRIAIAHRSETLRSADRVINLAAGPQSDRGVLSTAA